jgi:hypothetical protein
MGASCEGNKAAKPDVTKVETPEPAPDVKALQERIAKLEAQPMPSVVTLRALAKTVTKEDEQAAAAAASGAAGAAIDPETIELLPTDPVIKNGDGSIDYRMSRLMKARRLAREQGAAK